MVDCGSTRTVDSTNYNTSNVSLYDGGSLGCIDPLLPLNPSLNDVLETMAKYICAIGTFPTKYYADDVYTVSEIKHCGVAIPINSSLQDALDILSDWICDNEIALGLYIPKSTIAVGNSALVSDVGGNPTGLAISAGSVLGRKAAGNLESLDMTELTALLALVERDAVNGAIKPITTSDNYEVGNGTTANKTLLVVNEGEATYGNNPVMYYGHTTAFDGFVFFATDSRPAALTVAGRSASAMMSVRSIGATHTTDSQELWLLDTNSNIDPNYYWSFKKDGADSKKFKLQWVVSRPLSTSTYLTVTTAGTFTFGNGVGITKVVDEDTMVSDSATYLCTQQSIKAYVDNADGTRTYTSDYYVTDGQTLTASIDALDLAVKPIEDRTIDVELTITHAQILDLNGTPIELIAALGANLAPEIMSVSYQFKGGVTPYATNTNVQIYQTGANAVISENDQILISSVARTLYGEINYVTASATDTQMLSATAVMVRVETGNPTAGAVGQELVIRVRYKINNLS